MKAMTMRVLVTQKVTIAKKRLRTVMKMRRWKKATINVRLVIATFYFLAIL